MLRIFEFLISGCWHIWEESHRVGIVNERGVNIGEAVYCKCSKCGKPTVFDLI